MTFTETHIPGVWIIDPVRHSDSRGYFCETFRMDEFRRHIGNIDFVQENESMSCRGVVRGLHFQRAPHSQAKLVRVSQGRVLDVAVDLRAGSPTFGRHVAVELSGDDGRQMFVPRGFAHGFAVLSDHAQFQYKVDDYYHPECEGSIRFDAPELAIDWQIAAQERTLSAKDTAAPSWQQFLDSIGHL